MAFALHRCSSMAIKGPHPCWQAQKALDEAGVPYEIVRHAANPFTRSKRTELIELSGQSRLPVLQLEDGTVIRRESKELVAAIRDGSLLAGSSPAPAPTP